LEKKVKIKIHLTKVEERWIKWFGRVRRKARTWILRRALELNYSYISFKCEKALLTLQPYMFRPFRPSSEEASSLPGLLQLFVCVSCGLTKLSVS
jgi:hypothetical protein